MNKIIQAASAFLIFTSVSYSQWGGGLSANIKNEEPQKGIGFIITRNLPFQWPLIGLSVTLEADQFNQRIPRTDLTERMINLSMRGIFFFKNFQLYASFGPGFSFHESNDESGNSFLFNLNGGIRFAFIDPVYPFIGIKTITYFSELNKGESKAKTFQAAGVLGVILEF